MPNAPRRLLLDQRQSAGDVLVLTAAVRDLMRQHPGAYQVDYVGHHGRLSNGNNLWENNPFITPFYEGPPHDVQRFCRDCRYIMCGYGGGGGENVNGHVYRSYSYGIQEPHRGHFLNAFHETLSLKLGIPISMTEFKPDVYLSAAEREPWPGLPEKFAIVDAGRKGDFTTKFWSTHRFQQVVDATRDRVTWVQIGSSADYHPPLSNVVNLVGATNLRQLIQVFYRSCLVLTPVSLPMHLCAAVPTLDGKQRPCVVLMGRREQRAWEAYPYHTALGTDGFLTCGEPLGGGCWRNKTVQIDNDRSLCRMPMRDEVDQPVPECLHRITAQNVIDAVNLYL